MFWIGRLNILKMLIFPELIYRFNIFPTQIPDGFRKKKKELDKLILKCIWICERSGIAKTMLKKNKVVGLTLPTFKTYYEVIINIDSIDT